MLLFALRRRAGDPRMSRAPAISIRERAGQPLTLAQRSRSLITPTKVTSAHFCRTRRPTISWPALSAYGHPSRRRRWLRNGGGSLAEDVNGTNVIVNSDGSISMPPDIQPTAIGTPVGIVYDYDGTVTDALLGQGAGGLQPMLLQRRLRRDDNYGMFATYQHALIVMNGQCAQQSSQFTDVEYRLVRVIGNVLGLGWSQLNVNVHHRHAPSDDRRLCRFPVMHFMDPMNCVPITSVLSECLSAGNGRCRCHLATYIL